MFSPMARRDCGLSGASPYINYWNQFIAGKNVRKSQKELQAAVLLPSGCMNASGSWSSDQNVKDYS